MHHPRPEKRAVGRVLSPDRPRPDTEDLWEVQHKVVLLWAPLDAVAEDRVGDLLEKAKELNMHVDELETCNYDNRGFSKSYALLCCCCVAVVLLLCCCCCSLFSLLSCILIFFFFFFNLFFSIYFQAMFFPMFKKLWTN
mgnify:CR=1 FL=1